ncbi:YcbK family protein [Methylosarcina fibrata]|uniref:YcbK family protein n=1 Tax=Methylosarcina fibrata TaxID=105972 RepID=UPI00037A976B|nr:DUF882 domain-containing protein [Methylosarcina fibrata]
MKTDEDNTIASRRQFLKKLAWGSLMALSGSEAATAAVRHVIYPHRRGHSHEPAHPAYSHARKARPYVNTQPVLSPYLHAVEHKTLAFEHTHTGDKLKLTYFEHGRYIEEALREINYLLRDFRTDDVHPIDTALLDQLFFLKQTLGVNKPFHIISGYRSPFTNSWLRRFSHGVAEHSFHMQGRAIDIRLEGVSSKTIRNAALTLAQGGVGYYPRDNFVHLDTGRFRTW